MKNIKSVDFKNLIHANKTKNIILSSFLIVFLCGNLFFFTSNFILKDTKDYPFTPLNTAQFLYGSHEFTITRWDYAPDEHKMELELAVSNTANDGLDTYAVSAVSIPESDLRVTSVVTEVNYLIVQIEKLPKNFKAISFRVKIDDAAMEDQLKLYSNANTVSVVSSLPQRTKEEYFMQRIDRNIALYEAQIGAEQEKIEGYKEQISNIKKNNMKLEEDKKYLTVDEIESNNILIRNNSSKITDFEKLITESDTLIRETQEKIAMAAEKVATFKQ